METIYLTGQYEGWIINPLQDGLQIISPACGDLEIEQSHFNVVNITEKHTDKEDSEEEEIVKASVSGT